VSLNIEDWIFIAYFCIIIITMIILLIYIKKDYRKILISIIISSILIPFSLIIQEPFFNFLNLFLIFSNLVVFTFILFRPLLLIKSEKEIFLGVKNESDDNLERDIKGEDD